MGWSINRWAPKDPAALDSFFLVIGKALYIATSFEHKCKYVLRIIRIVEHFEETNDGSAALAMAAKDAMLRRTIDGLAGPLNIDKSELDVLVRASQARNFIAHEAAAIGNVFDVSRKGLSERLSELKHELTVLVDGDNLVSSWIYEIEEKERAPREVRDKYPALVMTWIFGE
jgi:hypothetical protein